MTKNYTIQKDTVHVIKENNIPVAVIYNDQKLRLNIAYPLGRAMSGETLGEFLSKIIPLPNDFVKEDIE